ncbi:MAG: gamma-glutamyltransferase [Gemmatimonadales bacterium]
MPRTIHLLTCFLAVGSAHQVGAQPVESTRGMVVSASGPASDLGAAILGAGGNAVDAAVATAFALAVTYPAAGNIGGGGFMVIRFADGRATAIDYRERAPLRATATMYLDSAGRIDRKRAHTGYLSVGVPGTVRGLWLAHRKYGKLPWARVVEPAVALARDGFVVSKDLAAGVNWLVESTRERHPETVAAYGKPGGGEWREGDRLVLPDLGRSLAAIAADGPDAFYKGWIGERLAAQMAANGGLISMQDLAEYRAVERAPIKAKVLGHEVVSMPPPSSGGTALVEMLRILEAWDIAARPRYATRTFHLMIEAMRRAYLDRAEFLGDADFGPVPVTRLTSAAHAEALARGIDSTRASSSVDLAAGRLTVEAPESDQTTHFSVVDAEGNAVANTYTLEQGFGSGIVVAGAGFILNDEMGDFNKKPGFTSTAGDIGTTPNLVAPGKRMLSSMTPAIVARDGKTVLVTGSPGGRTIINTVLQIVLNTVAFDMSARDAVDAPRIDHEWLPDRTVFEAESVPEPVLDSLRAMGHTVLRRGSQGYGHTIQIAPATGVASGANDRRLADSKAAAPDRR